VLWVLSVHGADGVRDVLEHLRVELVRAMQLAGTATLKDITADFIAPGQRA
jgi:isopentenyl diphosphate isomerase/L-lactate dehydrogenase-like FMN-dependent dehydrogenase